MKVVIASDFSGFRLKEAVKAHVLSLGYDLVDVGAQTEDDMTLYYDAAAAAARMIPVLFRRDMITTLCYIFLPPLPNPQLGKVHMLQPRHSPPSPSTSISSPLTGSSAKSLGRTRSKIVRE